MQKAAALWAWGVTQVAPLTVLPRCFCVFLYFPGPGGNREVRECAGGFESEAAQRDRDAGVPAAA